MRLRSSVSVMGVAVASALVLAACSTPGGSGSSGGSGDGAASAGAAGGTAIMSTPVEPDSLDATLANTFAARLVFSSFCEGLYTVDDKLNVIPQLAADQPKISDDGKTVDIPLKTGVKFADGTDFNADAVVKTLNRDLTMKGSARTAELSAVDSVSAVDDTHVQLKLKRPSAPLLAQLADRAGLIMSPTALDKAGDKFGENPVCVGPFKYKSRVAGSEMDFVKDPNYYDADKVKLDGVNYKFITESSVATSNLQSGDINAAEQLDPSDATKLKSDANFKVLSADSVSFNQLSINIRPDAGTALSKSPDLRKALEMSIDRDTLNKSVFQGTQSVDCQPLPLQSVLHSDVTCTPFDLAGAKKLVAASGVKTPIPVEMMVPTGAASQRTGQVLQAMAEAAGFKVSIRSLDLVSALNLTRAGKFDTFLVGWSGRVDPDGNTNDLLTTGGANNFAGLADGGVDKLVQDAGATNDPAQRKELYNQLITKVAEIRPNLYLYHGVRFTGTSSKLQGVVYNPDGIPRFKTATLSK